MNAYNSNNNSEIKMNHHQLFLARYCSHFYYIALNSNKHRLILSSIENLNCVYYINITDFKLFDISGRNQLIFKFFSKNSFSFYFIQGYDRSKFYQEVYPDCFKFPSNEYKISIIEKVKKCEIGFMHFLHCFSKSRISKLKMYYHHQLYDYIEKPCNINNCVFYYAQAYLIEKVFKLLFYSIKRIIPFNANTISNKNKKKKQKDLKNMVIKLEEQIEVINIGSYIDNNINSNNEYVLTDYEGNIIKDSQNFKHHSKIEKSNLFIYIYININIGGSKGEIKTIRSLSRQKIRFPKIIMTFDIITNHLFSQELSTLELDENGSIVLALKERTTFKIKDIISMDTTSKRNQIIVHLPQNRKIPLEFTQFFYKYVFKSIVYTHMLANLNKEHNRNKLQINFMCITWNLAGVDVPSDLGSVFNESKFQNVDFLTIGVQECSVFKTKNWQKHLKILLEYYGFECVESVKMCQMFLMVFVKKELMKFIEQIEIQFKPMGFAKVIGNKGGMVIAFQFMGYQFVIVNCHFCPKPYRIMERNEMVKQSIQTFRIGNQLIDFDVLSDYTIWGGDLNYRIGYTWLETINYLKNNQFEQLYERDQLTIQKNTNTVFTLYKEPLITFLPTYRRIKKKEDFDASLDEDEDKENGKDPEAMKNSLLSYSNKLGQSPSWCDRILIKSNREIDYLSYVALDDIKQSDHFPVEAHFNIYLTIPSVNNCKLNKGLNDLFLFQNIILSYQFAELFEELHLPIVYPFSLMIKLCHYLSDKVQETKKITIASEKECQQIAFEELSCEIMPQLIIDHGKAMNFFFVVILLLEKANPFEIGYSKYCLEDIEKDGHNNILHSNCKLDVSYLTRRMGILSFNYRL